MFSLKNFWCVLRIVEKEREKGQEQERDREKIEETISNLFFFLFFVCKCVCICVFRVCVCVKEKLNDERHKMRFAFCSSSAICCLKHITNKNTKKERNTM